MSVPFSEPDPIEFAAFIHSVQSAHFLHYANLDDSKVLNEECFAEMKSYLLKLYRGFEVKKSYRDPTGCVYDCIPCQQESGGNSQSGNDQCWAAAWTDYSPANSECPKGTIPLRRLTLDQLVRFETLEQFIRANAASSRASASAESGTHFRHLA